MAHCGCEDCFQDLPTSGMGEPGDDGVDGDSSYVQVAWATDAVGTGFTTNPADVDDTQDQMAVLISTTPVSPLLVGSFAALWFPFRGPAGPAGPAYTGPIGTTVSTVNNVGALATIVAPANNDLAFVLTDRSLYKQNLGTTTWIRQFGNGWTSNPANTYVFVAGTTDSISNGVFNQVTINDVVFWQFTCDAEFDTGTILQVNLGAILDPTPMSGIVQSFPGYYTDVSNSSIEDIIYYITTGKILIITGKTFAPVAFPASLDSTINISGFFRRSV